jgi:CheY-like chemotaxis protein
MKESATRSISDDTRMKKKKTILVVEDFASIRQFICESLHRKGYVTLDAGTATMAYQSILASEQEINLVITDYNMPDGTGYDLLKQIKLNPHTAHIPVIFLTTESNPELMRNAKEAGLAVWIKKPYRADAFFDQIERTIEVGQAIGC